MIFKFNDEEQQFGITLEESFPGQYTEHGSVDLYISDTSGIKDFEIAYNLAKKTESILEDILLIGSEASMEADYQSVMKTIGGMKNHVIEIRDDIEKYSQGKKIQHNVDEAKKLMNESIKAYCDYELMGEDEIREYFKITQISLYDKATKISFSLIGTLEVIFSVIIDGINKSTINSNAVTAIQNQSSRSIH